MALSQTVSGDQKDSGYADHPDHTIRTELSDQRIVVKHGSHIVGVSDRALVLHEASYKPVIYIPREDVDIALLERSARTSWCPFKGEASYFGLRINDELINDAVWSYEDPFVEVGDIKDFVAFYEDKVTTITDG